MRIIRTIAALISTSLLAYFVLSERSQSYAQLQQEPEQQLAQQTPQQPTSQQAKPQPQAPATPRPAVPSDDKLVMLIRSTLIALNQANATGNYTVFRDIAGPDFQEANSAAKLTEAFSRLRHRNLDLSPILLFQPKLLRRPEINADGLLSVTGFFPTEPERVNFDLLFQLVQGRWRLFGIHADTSWPQPAPQAAPSPAPETAAPQAKPAAPQPAPSAPKPPEKPKTEGEGDSATTPTSKPQVDVRRLEPAPTPQPEEPEPEENFNPFSR